ncbi:MAG TPA: ABC transporter ATP-binding protein [Candidatus Acidoferrum sp.]|nr:ABC transporter ATP-binding protein [Candidatus Acidoferrum sp.]
MALTISGVSERYKGEVWAVRDFSLDLSSGVLGLLGPNGAGKSTLMRMISTITKPTSGRIMWDSVDITRTPDRIRKELGYLPQDFGIYPHLSPLEFLTYLGAARGIAGKSGRVRINQLLDLVNLSDVRTRPLGSFSGGMKQRVGIAQALLNDPRILIVDEPTAGLDPEERVRFRNLLTELAGDRVIILSTHIVSDIEATANDIAIVNKGQLVTRTSPEQLLGLVKEHVWEMTVPSAELTDLKGKHLISGTMRTGDGVKVRVVAQTRPSPDARSVTPTLEDAYLFTLNRHRNNGHAA